MNQPWNACPLNIFLPLLLLHSSFSHPSSCRCSRSMLSFKTIWQLYAQCRKKKGRNRDSAPSPEAADDEKFFFVGFGHSPPACPCSRRTHERVWFGFLFWVMLWVMGCHGLGCYGQWYFFLDSFFCLRRPKFGSPPGCACYEKAPKSTFLGIHGIPGRGTHLATMTVCSRKSTN